MASGGVHLLQEMQLLPCLLTSRGRRALSLEGAGLEQLLLCKFTPPLLPTTRFPIQAAQGKAKPEANDFCASKPISWLFQNLTCELSWLAVV